MKDVTKRQHEVLEILGEYYPAIPSYREIATEMGIRSTNGVSDHVIALTRKGYIITGEQGKSRQITLSEKGHKHLGIIPTSLESLKLELHAAKARINELEKVIADAREAGRYASHIPRHV